mmetsp:Transcript_129422/g.414833  ORF Transcript_129422/g.414833 Transcript_129422/m.414833 type:complete len:332 (+) Transcript_129422:247-1242(+)
MAVHAQNLKHDLLSESVVTAKSAVVCRLGLRLVVLARSILFTQVGIQSFHQVRQLECIGILFFFGTLPSLLDVRRIFEPEKPVGHFHKAPDRVPRTYLQDFDLDQVVFIHPVVSRQLSLLLLARNFIEYLHVVQCGEPNLCARTSALLQELNLFALPRHEARQVLSRGFAPDGLKGSRLWGQAVLLRADDGLRGLQTLYFEHRSHRILRGEDDRIARCIHALHLRGAGLAHMARGHPDTCQARRPCREERAEAGMLAEVAPQPIDDLRTGLASLIEAIQNEQALLARNILRDLADVPQERVLGPSVEEALKAHVVEFLHGLVVHRLCDLAA